MRIIKRGISTNYCIKELPEKERPRERLKEVGVENLSDKELLSIVLKKGVKDRNVNELSIELLKKYELTELKSIPWNDLKKIKGIGEVKALELTASIELGKRVYLRDEKKLEKFDNASLIWQGMKYLFLGLKQEHFYCLYFNTKQELIKKKLIYIGTINSASTHTREIFKEAYLVSASNIICVHNHPSNDTTPSRADIIFTSHLMKTGEIQGIPVLDHIIIGKDSFYSFYEHKEILNL